MEQWPQSTNSSRIRTSINMVKKFIKTRKCCF